MNCILKKAGKENIDLIVNQLLPAMLEIDDHNLHINEHIAFMLGEEYEKAYENNVKIKDILLNHIKEHKNAL